MLKNPVVELLVDQYSAKVAVHSPSEVMPFPILELEIPDYSSHGFDQNVFLVLHQSEHCLEQLSAIYELSDDGAKAKSTDIEVILLQEDTGEWFAYKSFFLQIDTRSYGEFQMAVVSEDGEPVTEFVYVTREELMEIYRGISSGVTV